jgi:hypothetical protein
MTPCPWCGVVYELNVETEWEHLALCPVFQTLPVAEFKDGKTFVLLPGTGPDFGTDKILCERVRMQ